MIAIAQAKHCPELLAPSGKLVLNWPYDDGSYTSRESNSLHSLISPKTGSSYTKMNEHDHGVYTEIQPVQLMSLHLTVDSAIAIKEEKSVQYFRVDVGSFLMGWANNQLNKDSVSQYDTTGHGRYLMSPVTQSFQKRLDKRDWPMIPLSPSSGAGTCWQLVYRALYHMPVGPPEMFRFTSL